MSAQTWDERYRSRQLVWGAGPNQRFADAVADLPPGRALDLGCGEGRNAIWLATRGWTVTAVDFSSVGLERAAHLAEDRGVDVELLRHDVRTWEPPAGAFDLVALLYLHLPPDDLRRVHAMAAAAVAPGGTLIIIGHDRRNVEEGHGGPQDPERLLDPAEVAGQVPGLQVVTAETVTRTVATDPPATALDADIRAVRPG